MKDDDNLKNFYSLEKKMLKMTQKQRKEDLIQKKQLFNSRSSTSSKKAVLNKERLMIIITLIILAYFLLPIVQNYLAKSKISNLIQETTALRKDITHNITLSDITKSEITHGIPKDVLIEKGPNKIKINIGKTGRGIVNGVSYLYLEPVIDKNSIQWKCTVFGSGVQQGYLPSNCKLQKE